MGVGLNWENPVPESAIALRDLWHSQGTNPNPVRSLETLAAIVLGGIARGFCFLHERGAKSLAAACELLLTHLGKTVSFEGRTANVVGISERGDLRVRFSKSDRYETCLQPGAIALGYPAIPSCAVEISEFGTPEFDF